MLPIVEVPPLVEESVKDFDGFFSFHQNKHFTRYLTGLMTDSNVTVSYMAERFTESVSPRCLNRFLTEYEWDAQEFNNYRIQRLQEDPNMCWHEKGVIVIDDSLIEKTGELIPGAGKFYDHNSNSYVRAQNIVTSHYADWKKHYPLHFQQYYKEDSKESEEHGFQTKIQLAMLLVDESEKLKTPARVYVADSWFFCQELANHIESHNKDWVMAAKSNLLIWDKIKWVSLSNYAPTVPKEQYRKARVAGKTYYVHTRTVKLQSLDRKIKLAVSYDNPDLDGEPKFIVSNVKHFDRNKILRFYYLRHLIETFYRDAKQHLGLEGCQLRKQEGVHRHFTLVFTAYTILKQGVVRSSLCKWLKTRLETIGDGCRFATQQLLEKLVLLIHQLTQQKQTPTQIMQAITM
jgi:hypothetical protein